MIPTVHAQANRTPSTQTPAADTPGRLSLLRLPVRAHLLFHSAIAIVFAKVLTQLSDVCPQIPAHANTRSAAKVIHAGAVATQSTSI